MPFDLTVTPPLLDEDVTEEELVLFRSFNDLSIDEKEAGALIRGGFLTFDGVAYAEDGKLSSAMEIE